MAIVHLGAKRLQGIKSDRVSDSLGSSAGGTNSGVTLDTSNKKLGTGAYSLSGSNPVHFPNATANKLLPSTDDFSITCWVYHTGHSDHQQIFRCQDSNGSSEGEFRINSSGSASQDDKLALTLNDGTNGTGGSSATVMSTNSVTQNAWVHLAVTRTGATVKLYINGTLETNQNTSGTFSASSKWGITTPRIGRLENADETIQGKIDDMGVWHRVLTGTEITALYNSGTGALVSSLSSTVGLKAYYTMDSTALTSLKGTADWTEDFSETTPTAWAEDSSSGYANNLEPYKSSSNGLWFDLDRHASIGVTGTFDLQNAGLLGANPSNTLWTMRFKINFTSLSSAAGSMFIGLTDSSSAGANGACRFVGVRFKIGDGIRNISDNGGQALTVSNRTDGGLASTITTGTDYYVTVSRHTANTFVTTVRSSSHTGTVVGEVTADTLETATDDLRYWKIQNHRASANGGQLRGYVYDLEFFNDSATTTGCKNDASTTSELDGMTNLPANTIFEQTDDTPSYWWKQSDNTWKIGG